MRMIAFCIARIGCACWTPGSRSGFGNIPGNSRMTRSFFSSWVPARISISAKSSMELRRFLIFTSWARLAGRPEFLLPAILKLIIR